jgi:superfamily II DNA or RNA helicase
MSTLELGEFQGRDYQYISYNAVAAVIRNYKGPVFVTAATGSGKTLMMTMVARRCQDVGMRCLILARQGELVEQSSTTLWRAGVKNSIYSASLNSKSTTFPTIAASEGTFCRALHGELRNFSTDILLIDEAHMVDWQDCLLDEPETQYGKIIKELQKRNPKLRIIGYTGSPYRSSESIKGPFWKEEIANFDTPYLVGRGYLKPTIFGFGHDDVQYDLSQWKSTGEEGIRDFTKTELTEMQKHILSEGTKTQQIMIEVEKLAKDRGAVMITCAGKKHCLEVSKYLPDGSFGIVTDDLSTKKRKAILDQTREGEIKYLIQIGCLSTGVDLPIIDTIVLLRNVGSLTLLIQLIGRGLRPHIKSKKLARSYFATQPEDNELRQDIIAASTAPNALVLDYSSTLESLGEMYMNPLLEDAQLSKGKFKAELIECPSCSAQNSQFARRCIGDNLNSSDGRCEWFWQSIACECGVKNDTAARFCRSCQKQLIDPNAKLSRTHYTDADLKQVQKMTIGLTRCGNGILIRYILAEDETATEVFYPFSDNRISKMLWKNNFVFKHLNGLEFRGRVLRCRTATQIIGLKAVFDIPSQITHRLNDKKKSVINRKVFLSGREEIVSEQIPE